MTNGYDVEKDVADSDARLKVFAEWLKAKLRNIYNKPGDEPRLLEAEKSLDDYIAKHTRAQPEVGDTSSQDEEKSGSKS